MVPIEKCLLLIKNITTLKKLISNLPDINKQDENLIKNLVYHPLNEYDSWMKVQIKMSCKNKIATEQMEVFQSVVGYGDEFIVEKFPDKSFSEIQELRNNYDLCGTCIKNGLHSSWQKQKNF